MFYRASWKSWWTFWISFVLTHCKTCYFLWTWKALSNIICSHYSVLVGSNAPLQRHQVEKALFHRSKRSCPCKWHTFQTRPTRKNLHVENQVFEFLWCSVQPPDGIFYCSDYVDIDEHDGFQPWWRIYRCLGCQKRGLWAYWQSRLGNDSWGRGFSGFLPSACKHCSWMLYSKWNLCRPRPWAPTPKRILSSSQSCHQSFLSEFFLLLLCQHLNQAHEHQYVDLSWATSIG